MQVTKDPSRISQPIHAASAQIALRNGQFIPHFQPIVCIRTGQLEGFEILARWKHPELGMIVPDDFIPSAEKYGWIDALTRELLLSAFDTGSFVPEYLTFSINISPVQLRSSGFLVVLTEVAARKKFPLRRLVVEITESALIENLQGALEVTQELKRLGCKISLDDFGTGYSSLLHLQSLPFDELKVDRSFVKSMIDRRESRKIVAAVVGLGQSLGLRTLAEGIETREQAEMMLRLGCELGQGYFYGRPVPAEELGASVAAVRQKIMTESPSPWKKISAANLDVSPSQRLAQLQAIYDGAPVGLAFVDHNLRYVNLNQKLADWNGALVEDHLGSKVSDMIPELFPRVEPYIRRALNGEVISNVEAVLPHSETRLVSYQPAHDEAGEVVGVSISVIDISQRKHTEEALRKSEEHYKSMVELNPHVLWVMDPQGRNLDSNPRWDKATGLMKLRTTDHEWLNKIYADDRSRTVESITASISSSSLIDVHFRAGDDEGNLHWKRARGLPRFDDAGKIVCWYGSVQDTEACAASLADKCKNSSEGPIPSFAPESLRELPGASAQYEQPQQGSPSLNVSRPSQDGFLLNDDQRRVKVLLDLAILDTPGEAEFDDLVELASEICGTPISVVSLLDSERQWFKASVGLTVCETPLSVSFCAHAIQQRGLFMVGDATEDARFQNNPLVVGEPNIRFYAGMPLYAEEGVAIGTLCVMDTVPRSLSPGQAKALAILSHQVQARIELRSERINLLRVVDSNRQLTAALEIKNSTLSEANLQLERLATTDGLTGLLNRQEFENRMNAEFSCAMRKGRPLSTMVMDINDFKRRNDHLGHSAGDEALRHVGQVLNKLLRATDIAARIGGEEFAIILPETTASQAAVIAKRLQKILATGRAKFPRITLSIGIACTDRTGSSWEDLFISGDAAMYEARRAGKNRLVIAKPVHVLGHAARRYSLPGTRVSKSPLQSHSSP